MTEQVIDIRDRIEKMRNEITVPNKESVAKVKKHQFNKKNIEEIDLSKKPQKDKNSRPKNVEELDIPQKPDLKNNEKKSNFTQEIPKIANEEIKTQSYKKYDDYHNDRLFDEKKKSVKYQNLQARCYSKSHRI